MQVNLLWTLTVIPSDKEKASEYECEYSLKHMHPDAVTIDCNIAANPTICAFIGHQKVAALFEGRKFDRIIFEGFFPTLLSENQIAFLRKDIATLLQKDGNVYQDTSISLVELDPVTLS